jgi:hypothetical protein
LTVPPGTASAPSPTMTSSMRSSAGAGPSGKSISGFLSLATTLTVVGHTGLVDKDRDILDDVNKLIAEEQELRAKLQHHEIDETDEHRRLRAVEVQLDQCWDLLRQRRALREFGEDPEKAKVRPAKIVENYEQ